MAEPGHKILAPVVGSTELGRGGAGFGANGCPGRHAGCRCGSAPDPGAPIEVGVAEFACCGWEGTVLWAHEMALAANRKMQPANFLCNIVLLIFPFARRQNQRLSIAKILRLMNRNACDCLVSWIRKAWDFRFVHRPLPGSFEKHHQSGRSAKTKLTAVIVVPDCRGTQFLPGDGQPMCLAQEAHQLPETPIRTESSINLGN